MKKRFKGIFPRFSLLVVLISIAIHIDIAYAEGFFQDLMKGVSNGLQSAGRSLDPGSGTTKKTTNRRYVYQRKQLAARSRVTGFTTKAANIRYGPGTNNPKVGLLPANTRLLIVSTQGQWYQVQSEHNGSRLNGWIYAPLVRIDPYGGRKDKESLETLTYEGYSKYYLPIKKELAKGNTKGVEKVYLDKEKKVRESAKTEFDFIQNMGLLHWWERGTTAIDLGEEEQAVKFLDYSERLLQERQRESKIGGWFKTALNFGAETLSGNEELQPYSGEGYERVLMLNYKSIAYLLQGNRRAYNVTRRAIDWQNREKKQFEEQQREMKKELEEKKSSQEQSKDQASNKSATKNIMSRYAELRAKAKDVPSAYVNPFGYYVAGMIQEYESYDDWSLRDNARISYNKALKLNPKSKVLKKAVKDMKSAAPSGSRLVHVVVADGYVPEKKVLTYRMVSKSRGSGNIVIPIKLPIYMPAESRVSRIEVRTTGGKRLATLSPVADVEALCMRHQKDMEPLLEMRAMLAMTKSVGIHGLLAGVGQSIGVSNMDTVAQKIDETAAPDMRAWMSLPSTIQATRLRLRKGVSKLKIVTYDKRGRVLASKKVSINPNSHDFVYARSMGKTLIPHSAKKMWMLAGN